MVVVVRLINIDKDKQTFIYVREGGRESEAREKERELSGLRTD